MTALAEREPRTAPADNPLAILSAAVQSGVDPTTLERLAALAENWKRERAAEEFAVALNAAQSVLPCVVKDKANTHTNSRYASLENVNTVVRPVYTQHGFSLSFGTADSPLPGHMRVICDVSHLGGHTRRYHLDIPPDGAGSQGKSNKTGVQAIGSTLSYARRYLVLLIFNVTVADHDIDGEAADALDTITEAEALEVQDRMDDAGVNRVKFLEWLHIGGHLIPGERLVSNIRAKSLAAVLDAIQRKKGAAR